MLFKLLSAGRTITFCGTMTDLVAVTEWHRVHVYPARRHRARRGGEMATAGGSQPEWRRSSYCFPSECVEVAAHQGHALIRDSSESFGPVLRFTVDQWRSFARELNQNPSHEGNVIEVASS